MVSPGFHRPFLGLEPPEADLPVVLSRLLLADAARARLVLLHHHGGPRDPPEGPSRSPQSLSRLLRVPHEPSKPLWVFKPLKAPHGPSKPLTITQKPSKPLTGPQSPPHNWQRPLAARANPRRSKSRRVGGDEPNPFPLLAAPQEKRTHKSFFMPSFHRGVTERGRGCRFWPPVRAACGTIHVVPPPFPHSDGLVLFSMRAFPPSLIGFVNLRQPRKRSERAFVNLRKSSERVGELR